MWRETPKKTREKRQLDFRHYSRKLREAERDQAKNTQIRINRPRKNKHESGTDFGLNPTTLQKWVIKV